MATDIEKNMLADIRKGDEKAFEDLFKSFFAELSFYAVRFVEDLDSAEEIVQDIFFNVWNNRAKLNVNTSIKSYLYTTVKNTCLNLIKHKKVENKYKEHFSRELHLDELDESKWMSTDNLQLKIKNAINKLPAQRRKIFNMSRFDEMTYKQIATELEISVKTVENQMGSALKFLRKELKDFLPILVFLKYLFF